MIIGVVNANREATIRLVVHGANGQSQEIEAVIDTGFLTLPSSLIALLGLSWPGRQQAMLADGVVRLFDVYGATVIWDGQLRTVETDSADTEPLLGMGMIYGHDLRIQVVSGGTVTIEALP